jgi:hypothetical protein
MPKTYHPWRITTFRRAVCASTEVPRRDSTRLPICQATQSWCKRASGVPEGHSGRYWESCARTFRVKTWAYGAGLGRCGRDDDVASEPRIHVLEGLQKSVLFTKVVWWPNTPSSQPECQLIRMTPSHMTPLAQLPN